MRVLKAELTKKGQLKTVYKQTEVGRERNIEQPFEVKVAKSSNQECHRDLTYAFSKMNPHLLFITQLIDNSIAIPATMEPADYFNKFEWENDKRFEGVEVTGVETFGKHAVEGIRLIGHKEDDKGNQTKIKTPVVYFDRSVENHYPLLVLLEAQFETLQFEIEEYHNGKSVHSNQLSMELK